MGAWQKKQNAGCAPRASTFPHPACIPNVLPFFSCFDLRSGICIPIFPILPCSRGGFHPKEDVMLSPKRIAHSTLPLLIVLFLFTLTMAMAAAAPPSQTTLVQSSCQRCHSLKRVCNKLGQDQKSWATTLNRMQKKGSGLSDTQNTLLATFLSGSDAATAEFCK